MLYAEERHGDKWAPITYAEMPEKPAFRMRFQPVEVPAYFHGLTLDQMRETLSPYGRFKGAANGG